MLSALGPQLSESSIGVQGSSGSGSPVTTSCFGSGEVSGLRGTTGSVPGLGGFATSGKAGSSQVLRHDVSGAGTGRTGLGACLSLESSVPGRSQVGNESQVQVKGVSFDDCVIEEEVEGDAASVSGAV